MIYKCPLCLVILCLKTISAFNSDKNAYLILPRSPKVNASTISGSETLSAYFGTSLTILSKNVSSDFSVIITSPKDSVPQNSNAGQTKESGTIQHCLLGANFFSGGGYNCTATYPPNTVPKDGFGLSAAVRDDGHFMACSPVRPQKCKGVWYTPGYCYKTTDFGSNWALDKRTESLACPASSVDVLFIVDGSSSVGANNFNRVKNWIKKIVQLLDMDTVKAGVVQYSHYHPGRHINNQLYIVTEIKIGKYTVFSDFSKAVDRIKLHGYTTYTGRALQKSVFDFNGTENYGKVTNKQVMILLTDGKAAKADRPIIPGAASYLRDTMGVVTYAVGVGNSINATELKIIANGNKNNDRVLRVKTFADLDKIVEELQTEILSLVPEATGSGATSNYALQFSEIGISTTAGRSKQGVSIPRSRLWSSD